MSDFDQYLDEGYLLKSKLLDSKSCNDIIEFIETKKSTINIPFSEVGWGFGNLVENENMNGITNHKFILKFCRQILGEKFTYNHLMVNNKAPWIGPDVEWHQEVFNIDTYAPGANTNDNSWKNFLQIYIALDPHTLENGCLKIIPNSHKLGLLPHEDIINTFLNHKRRIPFDVMNRIYKTNGIKNLIMDRGDVLFFNHRFIHGSSSNNSPFQRRAIVLQARKEIKRDEEKFKQESFFRKNFVIEFLNQKLNKLTGNNMYDSFNSKK